MPAKMSVMQMPMSVFNSVPASISRYRAGAPRRFPDPADSLPDPVWTSDFVYLMTAPAVR
jgi:hypothetical protein